MTYELKLAGLTRKLSLCRAAEDLYIGAFVSLGDPELCRACARDLLKVAPEYDYLITAETKGIPLAHEMAAQHGDKKFFVARKSPKLYMADVFKTEVQSITTEGRQILCLDKADAEEMKGKRILIVDDVISTGASLRSLEILVNAAGGNIIGRMAILAEGAAADREDLIFLEKLPLFNPDGSIKD